MTDKELRRMSRRELLEMLIFQTTEVERLQSELAQAQSALLDRRITIEKAGSIAEASLQLSGIFDAAQSAAEQYLENLRQMNSQQQAIAQKIQADAKQKADAMIAEADAYRRKTHADADAYWQRVSGEARALMDEHKNPRNLIRGGKDPV